MEHCILESMEGARGMVITMESTNNDSIGNRQAESGWFNLWLVLQISGVFEEEQIQFSPPQTFLSKLTR